MSDLQCPVRLLLVSGPSAATAERLRHERVAKVYDAPPRASAGATELAEALGVPVDVLGRAVLLEDVRALEPETAACLQEVADLHRGEAVVLVVTDAGEQVVEVSLDGDGMA